MFSEILEVFRGPLRVFLERFSEVLSETSQRQISLSKALSPVAPNRVAP